MLSSVFARAAHRAVLWCLLIAVPVYAVSLAVAQAIGSQPARRATIRTEPVAGWHDVQRAIGHDMSSAPRHRSTFEEQCQVPAAPAAVALLDARVLDSLGDDSSDATSGFGFALIALAPIEPPEASSSPPRHSHAIAVLTREAGRLDRPPKA